jgi:photosystem II stability/assembly factor-like uncharacterized protein
MKKILITLFILSSVNLFSQQAWYTLFYGQALQYNCITFVNAQTGWIAASGIDGSSPSAGSIMKTTNGGVTWTSEASSISFRYIHFINSQTGWAAGDKYGNSGVIRYLFKTTNGGINFIEHYSEEGGNDKMVSVKFANENTGYAISRSKIFKSTNGGINWFIQDSSGAAYNTLCVMSSNIAAVCSDYASHFYTNDGGVMWNEHIQTDNNRFNTMFYYNAATGWLGDKNGKVLNSWNAPGGFFTYNNGFSNKNLFFVSPLIGWGTNDFSTVSRTTNGGENWSFQILPYPDMHFSSMFFLDAKTGWIVGKGVSTTGESKSILIKTTTGGLTFVNQISSVTPDKFSLSQNYPNPFNPNTKINYELPITNFVSVIVYDALGNEVEKLVNEKQNAGSYSVDFNAASLPSGIYFYKLVTEKFSETKKMILVK